MLSTTYSFEVIVNRVYMMMEVHCSIRFANRSLPLSLWVRVAVLYFLLQVSFLVDEGVSPVLLQLLSCALCGSKVMAASSSGASGGGSGTSQPSQSKSSSKKSKKEDKEKDKEG